MKLLIVSMCVALAACDVSHIVKNPDQDAKILSQQQDLDVDGRFNYGFDTDNGISIAANGAPKNVGQEDQGSEITGQIRYVSPEGETIETQYIANEGGYQPQGSHIPTAPPIPEAILRALEYIRAHPPPPEAPLKN